MPGGAGRPPAMLLREDGSRPGARTVPSGRRASRRARHEPGGREEADAARRQQARVEREEPGEERGIRLEGRHGAAPQPGAALEEEEHPRHGARRATDPRVGPLVAGEAPASTDRRAPRPRGRRAQSLSGDRVHAAGRVSDERHVARDDPQRSPADSRDAPIARGRGSASQTCGEPGEPRQQRVESRRFAMPEEATPTCPGETGVT